MIKKVKKQQSNQGEVRVHTSPQKFEIRKSADGSGTTIGGYAAVFDRSVQI